MRKEMIKSISAVLLAAAVMVSFMPTSAWADVSGVTDVSSATEETHVTLSDDEETPACVDVSDASTTDEETYVLSDEEETPAAITIDSIEADSVQACFVHLSWSSAGESAVYTVYRSHNGTLKKLNSLTGTEYKDESVLSQTKYTYYVKAVLGESSCKSNSVTVSTPRYSRPELTRTYFNPKKGAVVSWRSVMGAAGYKIYRKVKGGRYYLIKTTSSLSYTDASVKCTRYYTYKVCAYRGKSIGLPAISKEKNIHVTHFARKVVKDKASTCTRRGYTRYTCKKCGRAFNVWKVAAPHKFSEWKIVDPVTSTSEGKMKRTCSVCGIVAQAPAKTENDIVDYAIQYVGNPYTLRGTSMTTGIDCSHFVYRVLRATGHYNGYWHFSQEWVNYGKDVSVEDIQPGDIIVLDGHVAIYMGNNQIVHASGSAPYPTGGIRIQQFDSIQDMIDRYCNVYNRPFLGIRRFE